MKKVRAPVPRGGPREVKGDLRNLDQGGRRRLGWRWPLTWAVRVMVEEMAAVELVPRAVTRYGGLEQGQWVSWGGKERDHPD